MWGLELNTIICLLLLLTTRAACVPIKACPHKQPGNGCVLDLSQSTETHGHLLYSSCEGNWVLHSLAQGAHSGFPTNNSTHS